jgi:hypothetical protein
LFDIVLGSNDKQLSSLSCNNVGETYKSYNKNMEKLTLKNGEKTYHFERIIQSFFNPVSMLKRADEVKAEIQLQANTIENQKKSLLLRELDG